MKNIREPRHSVLVRALILALDLVMMAIAMLSLHLCFWGFHFGPPEVMLSSSEWQQYFLFDGVQYGYFALLYTLISFYRPSLASNRYATASQVMERCAVGLGITVLLARLLAGTLPFGYLLVVWAFAWILVTLEQLTVRDFLIYRRNRKGRVLHVALAGSNPEIKDILKSAHTQVVTDHVYLAHPLPEASNLESLASLEQRLEEKGALSDAVFCAIDQIPAALCQKLVAHCRRYRIPFYAVPSHTGALEQKLASWQMGNAIVYTPEPSNLENVFNRGLKRVLDFVFSLIALLTIFPWVYLLIAIFMKRQSAGPVIIEQTVKRLNGKTQTLFAFRTFPYLMPEEKEEEGDYEEEEEEEDFPLAKFLNDTHLEKLPMLFNVLWGNASLVGALPEDLNEEAYRQHIRQRTKLNMKPGLICAHDSAVEEDCLQKAVQDTLYVRHWTLWKDLCSLFAALGRLLYRVF